MRRLGSPLRYRLNPNPRTTITTDASPYGLGGVLEQDDTVVSFFASPITDLDRSVLSLGATPSSSDQQALEALALLVALREWSPMWQDQRVTLSVRSDNIVTLTMLCRMQPHSVQLGIIARELALGISTSSGSPDSAVHIPGGANTAPDALSRLWQPGKHAVIPQYLDPKVRLE